MSEVSESEIPWGMVVESDQVYSEANRRWYTVESTVAQPAGKVRVKAEGVTKAWTVNAQKSVKVRRGPTGKAVDVIQIVFSGEMKL